MIVFDGICVLCNGWVRFLTKGVSEEMLEANNETPARKRPQAAACKEVFVG